MGVKLSWGLQPPEGDGVVAAWGCRAIKERDFIDFVPDRRDYQGLDDPGFKRFIDKIAAPWFSKVGVKMRSDSDEVLYLHNGLCHAKMSPNRSYGYLYVGAWMEKVPDWKSLKVVGKKFSFVNNGEMNSFLVKHFPGSIPLDANGLYVTPEDVVFFVDETKNEASIYPRDGQLLSEERHYLVYHLTEDAFSRFNRGEECRFQDDYALVAQVCCRALGEVFNLTNHIDKPWQQNDGVQEVNPQMKKRSTSVGDVVLWDDKGVYYLVANLGHRIISKEAVVNMEMCKGGAE
ncbi:MAG TPA: hypothetical protein PKV86_00525 [Syntrophobacteraceae bacterium]|jgi:hypothetical protein|nr:hypothetical protein [Syntrophobacteraceae bacterium]